MSPNPPDSALRQILVDAKTIAVVGASSNPARSSHGVMGRLMRAGYRCIPVNPNETEVLGVPAVAALEDIREPVDIVDVFRRSELVAPVAESAVKIGAKVLWLQLGVMHEDAAAHARAAGLTVIQDLCIAVVHSLERVPTKTATTG